ncbi:hypothetical protein J6590_010817 [Homalodisca vitripennis]|nr:hypothetical protein J6590_010817 [Homalodisca vitripennis]
MDINNNQRVCSYKGNRFLAPGLYYWPETVTIQYVEVQSRSRDTCPVTDLVFMTKDLRNIDLVAELILMAQESDCPVATLLSQPFVTGVSLLQQKNELGLARH